MNNIDNLKKYVQTVAKKTMGTSVDQTILTGTITHIAADIYEIQIEATAVPIYATAPNRVNYKEGDKVFLVCTESNTGDTKGKQYQIFGLVNLVTAAYKASTEYERFVADLDNAKNSDVTIVVSPSAENESVFKSLDNNNLLQTVKLNGYIDLQATFNLSESLSEKQDYGLKLEVEGEDGKILETFLLNPPYFTGQPYKAGERAQHRFIKLNKNTHAKLKNLKLSAYNKTVASVTITNIKLVSGSVEEFINNFKLELHADLNYLAKESDEKIVVTAKGFFEDQELSNNVLKYFWFIKDDSITTDTITIREGELVFDILVGAGWKCLTEWSYAKVVKNGALVSTDTKLWKAKNNYYSFKTKNLPKYENIVKCIATYQGNAIESAELALYNYEHENVDGTITADKQNLVLYYPEDVINLTCVIEDNNEVTKATEQSFVYEWYANGILLEEKTGQVLQVNENLPIFDVFYEKQENLSSFKTGIIYYIYENEKYKKTIDTTPQEGVEYYIKKGSFKSGIVNFSCKAFVKKSKDNIIEVYDSANEGPEILIGSNIQDYLDGLIVTETEYYYWISENNNEGFRKEIVANDVDGSGQQLNSYIKWISVGGLVENEGDPKNDDILLNNTQIKQGKNYFIYLSSQDVIKKGEEKIVVNKLNWNRPIIARHIFKNNGGNIIDLYTQEVLDQLNTFNSLTQNGSSQGIYYKDVNYIQSTNFDANKLKTAEGYYKKVTEESYVEISLTNFNPGVQYYYKDNDDKYQEVTDSNPVDGRIYYIKETKTRYELLEQNSDNYTVDGEGKPTGFIAGKDYYEKDGNELYINATYIRTGALTVGDGDNPIFQAGWDTAEDGGPQVQIAGFNVTNDSIAHEDDVVLSPTKFIAGDGINATKQPDGTWNTNFKGKITTGHFEEDDNGNVTSGFQISTDHTDGDDKDKLLASKNFTVYQSGKLVATEGEIGDCVIKDGHLSAKDLGSLSANLGRVSAGTIESSNFKRKIKVYSGGEPIEQLETPIVQLIDESLLEIDDISNAAEKFDILIDGVINREIDNNPTQLILTLVFYEDGYLTIEEEKGRSQGWTIEYENLETGEKGSIEGE